MKCKYCGSENVVKNRGVRGKDFIGVKAVITDLLVEKTFRSQNEEIHKS